MFAQNQAADRIVNRLFKNPVNWQYGFEVAKCLLDNDPLPEIGGVDPIVAAAIRSYVALRVAQ